MFRIAERGGAKNKKGGVGGTTSHAAFFVQFPGSPYWM